MESPCPDVSTLGKTLNSDYGWNKGDYKKDGWLEKRILSNMGLGCIPNLCKRQIWYKMEMARGGEQIF